MTACGAIGALMVGGRVVGQLRCEYEAGHADPERDVDEWGSVPWAHGVTLEWAPEHEVDLDLFDPDERFDVVVDL